MSESKELLEATIKGLKEKVNQLNTEVTTKEKELEDINKPEMTGEMFDELHGLVEDGVGEFDFCDVENYEWEPEFDYDNKVVIGNIDLTHKEYVKEPILKLIENKFNIIDDTEVNTVTEVQKVI